MSLPPLTTRQLTGALFGWLGTGFATWLLIPAWKEVLEQKPAPISTVTALYFGLWLAGDFAHLAALIMEEVGPQQWGVYCIIAAFEILILLTLLSKWLLYRKERKQKGEEESTEEALGLIIAGWSISFEPLGEEKKVAGPTFGRSPLFWQIFWTVIFVSIGVGIWLILSVKRIGGLAAPKASSWPHDTLSTIALGLGFFGFVCWTLPRVLTLVTREDDISTASVVIGFGAHLCNMINIGIINFTTLPSTFASSPFFLTSFFCIFLDAWRLHRKAKRASASTAQYTNYVQTVVQRTAPREVVDSFRRGDLSKRAGNGTWEQKLHTVEVEKALRSRENALIEELRAILRDEKLWKNGEGDEELVHSALDLDDLDRRWCRLCSKEGWDQTNLEPATSENQTGVPEERPKKPRSTFGAIEYEAAQARRALKYVFGHGDPRVVQLDHNIDAWDAEREQLRIDILNCRKERRADERDVQRPSSNRSVHSHRPRSRRSNTRPRSATPSVTRSRRDRSPSGSSISSSSVASDPLESSSEEEVMAERRDLLINRGRSAYRVKV